jgi:hypothetical protein
MGAIKGFLTGAGLAIAQHHFNFRLDKLLASILGKVKRLLQSSSK